MTYTFTEKKRIRKNFSKHPTVLDTPYLLSMQLDSYRDFLQKGIPSDKRADIGLHEAFSSIFPIESHNGLVELQYVGYELGRPEFDVRECQLRGVTYASPLRVRMRLAIYDKGNHDKRKLKQIIESEPVFMGEMVPSVSLSPSCTVLRGSFSTTIKASATVPANCCFLLALFPIVALG